MIRYEHIPNNSWGISMTEDYIACKNTCTFIVVSPTLVINPLFSDKGRHDNGP